MQRIRTRYATEHDYAKATHSNGRSAVLHHGSQDPVYVHVREFWAEEHIRVLRVVLAGVVLEHLCVAVCVSVRL